jgi:hypothetical protein
MLQPMQQAAESAPSPTSASFAGLMAALASPAPKPAASDDRSSSQGWKSAPAWDDDGLEDDVATLSYERALRTHARYRAADPDNRSLTQTAPPVDSYETLPAEAFAAASKASPNAPYPAGAVPAPTAVPRAPVLFEKNLKSASITIRVSKEECEQLHQRAAEAGLTVSAYLRSCTFEAESLRALVKDTMAQLKPVTAAKRQQTSAGLRGSWFGWMARLLTPWQGSRRVARA